MFLRKKLGIDYYSWKAFEELLPSWQDELLLFMETLAQEFERHPERWGPCFSQLARNFRVAQRIFIKSLGPISEWKSMPDFTIPLED